MLLCTCSVRDIGICFWLYVHSLICRPSLVVGQGILVCYLWASADELSLKPAMFYPLSCWKQTIFVMLMLCSVDFFFAITKKNPLPLTGMQQIGDEVPKFLSEGEQSKQESASSIKTVCVEKLAPKMAFPRIFKYKSHFSNDCWQKVSQFVNELMQVASFMEGVNSRVN